MNGVSVVIKETPQNSLDIFAMRGYREKLGFHEIGSKLLPDAKSFGALILDSPDSRSVRNKSVFINHLV